MPEPMSMAARTPSPTRFLARARPTERLVNQVAVPQPTPMMRRTVALPPPGATAANTAAQLRMVEGFDAVAERDVRNARPGEPPSSLVSPPSRTRKADHNVRAPNHAIT